MHAISLDQPTILAFAGLLIWAAISDVRTLTIPNWLTMAALLLYPVYLAAAYAAGRPLPEWHWAVAIAAGAFAFGAGLFFLKLMGGGDVKLLAVSILWAGPDLTPAFIIYMAFIGGLLALGYLFWTRLLPALVRMLPVHNFPALAVLIGPGARGGPKPALPYGVAIAGSGLYVAAMLLAT